MRHEHRLHRIQCQRLFRRPVQLFDLLVVIGIKSLADRIHIPHEVFVFQRILLILKIVHIENLFGQQRMRTLYHQAQDAVQGA